MSEFVSLCRGRNVPSRSSVFAPTLVTSCFVFERAKGFFSGSGGREMERPLFL